MNDWLNIVANTSYALQINDKEVDNVRREKYYQRPEVKARKREFRRKRYERDK